MDAGTGEQGWQYAVTAEPKNTLDVPEIKKTAKDGNGTPITSVSVEDVVHYEVEAEVPSGDGALEKYEINDTMSKGLAFDPGSVEITGYKNAEDLNGTDLKGMYTVTPDAATDGTTATNIKIAFTAPGTDLHNQFNRVVIKYTATVTKDAITDKKVENQAELNYGNDPIKTDKVVLGVYGYMLTKVNGAGTGLAEAKFLLFKNAVDASDNTKAISVYHEDTTPFDNKEIVSGTDGTVKFYGLAAGKYYLKEIKAPNGYTALKDTIEITVTAESDGNSQINIVNTEGFSLPAAGGVGTVIFTVGGIILMLGAAILLVRANKKSRQI